MKTFSKINLIRHYIIYNSFHFLSNENWLVKSEIIPNIKYRTKSRWNFYLCVQPFQYRFYYDFFRLSTFHRNRQFRKFPFTKKVNINQIHFQIVALELIYSRKHWGVPNNSSAFQVRVIGYQLLRLRFDNKHLRISVQYLFTHAYLEMHKPMGQCLNPRNSMVVQRTYNMYIY